MRLGFVTVPVVALVALSPLQREPLRVATAANFALAADSLATVFTALSGHETVVVSGATGLLYAQIVHGAPFDILLAADTVRPALLERDGYAVAGSRYAFGSGRLALWSTTVGVRDSSLLFDATTRTIAMAKPETAPYGAATRTVLERLALWDVLATKLVRGENVSQAFQLVASGAATAGFVARSAVRREPDSTLWVVPSHLHDPLQQEAVLLTRAADNEAARAFMQFLSTSRARGIIRAFGYDLPLR